MKLYISPEKTSKIWTPKNESVMYPMTQDPLINISYLNLHGLTTCVQQDQLMFFLWRGKEMIIN